MGALVAREGVEFNDKSMIFAGKQDFAVALKRAQIPFAKIPIKVYEPGNKKGQVPVDKSFGKGQHINLAKDLDVQTDVMNFLYGG